MLKRHGQKTVPDELGVLVFVRFFHGLATRTDRYQRSLAKNCEAQTFTKFLNHAHGVRFIRDFQLFHLRHQTNIGEIPL